ncbi:MAG: ammonium transporter [Rhodospirillales bacterium]|nr:ammonium transporter [Rhodospirillales bacterium]MCB9995205.1 ammonium transporter [Rhodospirillales bacterium]
MIEITETAFIMNTFFLLICGALVMFMAAGFAMLEAGSVRSKSVAVILVKNIGLYAIAGIMYFLAGYNLMYLGVDGGFIGTLAMWHPDDHAAIAGDYSAGYASAAGWFFQMVFVATAASIVSGALAERIKLWPFFIFCAILCAFIYPVAGSWVWGGGWLSEMGFKDFAGSTLVHSVGGWAALTGAILLGARRGRFSKDGKPKALHGSSMPLATLGAFILWFGWFGFNGGSQLSIATTDDALAVAKIFANTNMAAAAGVVTVLAFYLAIGRKVDLTAALNGALAGLVAITAEPLMPSALMSVGIGSVGAIVMLSASKALETAKIDDVVGAVPVHLAAGIWGTLAVVLSNPEASLVTQLIGITSVGAFVSSLSFALWAAMKYTYGIRLHWSHEDMGGDIAELGIRAYNLDHGFEEQGKAVN